MLSGLAELRTEYDNRLDPITFINDAEAWMAASQPDKETGDRLLGILHAANQHMLTKTCTTDETDLLLTIDGYHVDLRERVEQVYIEHFGDESPYLSPQPIRTFIQQANAWLEAPRPDRATGDQLLAIIHDARQCLKDSAALLSSSIGAILCRKLKALAMSVWNAVRAILKFFCPCCFKEPRLKQHLLIALAERYPELFKQVEECYQHHFSPLVDLTAAQTQPRGIFSGTASRDGVNPTVCSVIGLAHLWTQLEQGHALTTKESTAFIDSIIAHSCVQETRSLNQILQSHHLAKEVNPIIFSEFCNRNSLQGAIANKEGGGDFFVLFDGRGSGIVYIDRLAEKGEIEVMPPRAALRVLQGCTLTPVVRQPDPSM